MRARLSELKDESEGDLSGIARIGVQIKNVFASLSAREILNRVKDAFKRFAQAIWNNVKEVNKALTGRTLEDQQFEFELAGQNVENGTATNDADGKVTFEKINFTEADAGQT